MYGIVEIGGHQYSVKSGDVLDVEKLESEVGSVVSFDKVLFIGGDAPHRQLFTSLLITSVKDGAGKVSEIDKASKEAQKYLK